MTATIELYNRKGTQQLAELRAGEFQLGTRSYCLTKIGDCDFRVPANSAKATADNLGSLNLLVIRSDTGAPNWGGRIESVEWKSPEWVDVKAASKESLLRRQNLYELDALVKGAATTGQALEEIIGHHIRHGLVGLTIGKIDRGGPVLRLDCYGEDIWDTVIPKFREKTREPNRDRQYECWVTWDGKFYWQPQRGKDRRGEVLLVGGSNGHIIGGAGSYRIDYSKIITTGHAFGPGNWEHKIRRSHTDYGLQYKWGVLSASTDVGEGKGDAVYQAAVMLTRGPAETFDLTINNRNGIWSNLGIGDIIRVRLPHHGWVADDGALDTDIRITAFEIQEEPQRMRLIAKVWES